MGDMSNDAAVPPPLHEQPRRKRITRDDLRGESYDPQGIDWTAVNAPPEAGHWRRQLSFTHRPVQAIDHSFPSMNFFSTGPPPWYRFRFFELATTHIAGVPHDDLRNVLACPSIAEHFYASRSTVYRTRPLSPDAIPIFSVGKDSNPIFEPWAELCSRTAISTLAADRTIVAIGSFDGRYAYQIQYGGTESPFTQGRFGEEEYINHIALPPPYAPTATTAALCSNSNALGLLDLITNKITTTISLPHAANCSAPSPDGHRHLVVGDGPRPLLIDARVPRPDTSLAPHAAHQSLACAWSGPLPDGGGELLATGAEDRCVRLFDPRRGDRPVYAFETPHGGARVLAFSPADALGEPGGGDGAGSAYHGSYEAPALLAAEPHDAVTLVSAAGPERGQAQRVRFFGEVSGAAWVGGGGGHFVVAIADWRYGGLMEFERRGDGEVWKEELEWEPGLGKHPRDSFDPAALRF